MASWFSSPAVFHPYEGRAATMTVLRAVVAEFEDFRYTATYQSDDGHVLRFAARVGERELEGVDLARIDANGLVTDLTVMIRPFHALRDVIAAMGAALEQQQG